MKRSIIGLAVSLFIFTAFSQVNLVDYGNNPKAGHFAKINGIELYYEVYGSGEPLVMLHGNGGSINAFRNQIPFLGKYYQVIAIDSRLQGKSGGSVDTISYDMMAADFCALMDYLQVGPAYVLGWSDGGIDGLMMAMKCPGKVKKLAVSGANTVPDSTAIPYHDILSMIDYVYHDKNATPVDKALNKMMIYQPNIPWSDLGKISCPVLVMAGDHDIIKPEHTLKIYQSIPGAQLCIFPDSNHGVCQQHPDLFNQTVLNFFKNQSK
jgi:pimeloyl-ACP methyl ester carboxylesterase